jgi:tetratricopeptide (TPR) repeat protein
MHDLIRRYAADLAAEEEPRAGDALRRVLDHYLAQAVEHDRALPAPQRPRPATGDPARAMAWFDLEYVNLVAAFDAAVRLGADEVVAGLPPAMRVWFFRHRGTDDQTRMLAAAAEAAGRLGLADLRSELLSDLGFALAAAGRLDEALAAYQRAEPSAAVALRIGFVHRDRGEFALAQADFRRARELFERDGNRAGQAQALAFDGWVTLHLGGDAAALARASLDLAEGPARIPGLVTLGLAEDRSFLDEALRLAEEHNLQHQQAWCHSCLGIALREAGRFDEALSHHQRALELLEPLAEAQLEADCRRAYAETLQAADRRA